MANKDITATVIANILNLINTANSFANATVRQSKQYITARDAVRSPSEISIIPQPNLASTALQTWFNTYIKPGATSAGTATVSSKFTTTAKWRTDFFNTRTELLANASPAAITALDIWFTTYTEYRLKYKSTRR
jgi:hypothetical protein